MKNKIALLAIWLTPSVGLAESPAVPAASKQLECLVGTWNGTGTVRSDGKDAAVRVEYRCSAAASGWGVRCHLTARGIPGMTTYELDDVWGYDAGDSSYHWFAVTNAGETHDHKGTLEGPLYRGQFVGKREGKPFVESVEFRFAGTKQFRLSWTATLGGQTVESGAAELKRAGG